MLNYQDEAEAKRSKPGWKFPSEFRIQFNKILQACRMVLKSCKMVQNVGYWRSHQWRNCTSLSEGANWKLQLGRQLMSGILIHCCKVAFIWLLMHGDSDGPREWRGGFFACRNLGSWIQQGLAAALKTCFFCSTHTRSSLKFRSVYVEDGRKSWWGNGQCVWWSLNSRLGFIFHIPTIAVDWIVNALQMSLC